MTPWKDSIALVTGGGSGIGRELSRALARRGALVHVSDVNAGAAEKTAAEIGARGAAVDVRHADAVRAWIEGVASERGRIDFLFNNAGMSVKGEAQELTLAHWDRLIDVNLRGVVHGVVAAYPIMVKQRSGHIVNTASMAGLAPVPLLTPYGATKHAIVGLSTSLRVEAHAYGVRVSVLCPSAIETPALDRDNPEDLPQPSWRPNLRRYLKGPWPPYPADRLAEETLDAVERNVGIIVLPSRARTAWRVRRWLPALVERFLLREVARERRDTKSGV